MPWIWFLCMFQLDLKRPEFCQIPLSLFCLLAKALVHWQCIKLSVVLVKKNEDKETLITLKKIFQIDTWKNFI